MANRSYLYSGDNLPDSAEWESKRVLRGISECNYAIPLIFKILLTGNPIAIRSSIWETPEKLAIAGDYQLGLRNLEQFLGRIREPKAIPLVEESIQFLRKPSNVREHFILECGEIFDMTDGSLEDKNCALLAEIKEISSNIGSIDIPVAILPPAPTQHGLLSRLFRRKEQKNEKLPDPLTPYYEMGLGCWSNVLYFDFSENET